VVNLTYATVVFLALVGLTLAFYIHHKKAVREKFICPAGFDCETVIYSKYSKFLGVPVEDIGIIYYLVVAFSYATFLLFPQWDSESFSFTILSITTLAFIFSVYLTYIQAVLLKEWCTWCLLSAKLCTLIFIAVWLASDLEIIEFIDSTLQNISQIFEGVI
jgi:uncharacterized membrane protein